MEHKYKSLLDVVLSFLSSPSSFLERLTPLPIRCVMLQNTGLLGVPTHSIPISNPCLCSYLTCCQYSFSPFDLAVSLHFLSLILGILFLKEPFLTTFSPPKVEMALLDASRICRVWLSCGRLTLSIITINVPLCLQLAREFLDLCIPT